ncbi:MAG: hypothetical protein ACI9EF_003790, partial [Pseudohongiellaceae bacterium]
MHRNNFCIVGLLAAVLLCDITTNLAARSPLLPSSGPTVMFSNFAFGGGVPFAGGTSLAGVPIALTSTSTEPWGATAFRDNLSLNPAEVDFVFTSPISEFHLDVSFVKADEFLTNFSLGAPDSLTGTLVNIAGRVTTSGSDDLGFGRLSWTNINVLTVGFTIDAEASASAPALAVNQFGFALGAPQPIWTDQGSSLAGVSGSPFLQGCGTLVGGSQNSVDLSNAAPSALAGLFLGLSSAPVPFKGGTLLPAPLFAPVLLNTSVTGTI